ncbi:hypothetical protein NQX30_05985 [Candidatus Persebacteraceae bacterium Df01]|jgi:hypothetical protein|uniref:Uncharacterized protein n=1 Tax=Candidatus Doriopsillibacter californiensis TaxID=2970740 RepID=A0ABT7QMS2_9GAMM|nr:hypothetical protein [Candidatus Persebacteraceae bacterium Df01]
MCLQVLGALSQTRLSFMRALLRDINNWHFSRPVWEINAAGVGHAVYEARGLQHVYSLVVFSHNLSAQQRSDRVIAEAWDATFTLFDGVPTKDDLQRLRTQVPLQEAGRNDCRQFVLSRANRSVRLFESVVDALAAGQQPDEKHLQAVGYLMRTTAVYGNGKFGIADRARVAERIEFAAPFRVEMLAVWLFRAFPVDLVEHMALARSPQAVRLSIAARRQLGIGNSTGLGMAPFLISHPVLLHHWILARETALARVRAISVATPQTRACFVDVLKRARRDVALWTVDDGQHKITPLAADLHRIDQPLMKGLLHCQRPWDLLYRWADDHMQTEGREMLVSLILEPHGELVDDLTGDMAYDEAQTFVINGKTTVTETLARLQLQYDWIWRCDFSDKDESARFWYTSEEKMEPRLGERFSEPGAGQELPLAIMRDMQSFWCDLKVTDGSSTLASFLLAYPQHRHVARREQIVARFPYGEIQDNLISATMRPLDLLRCKLSFFGATCFSPRSDRWLRVNMYAGAPYPHEINSLPSDGWVWSAA